MEINPTPTPGTALRSWAFAYSGTSLIREIPPLQPYSRPVVVLRDGLLLMSEVLCRSLPTIGSWGSG